VEDARDEDRPGYTPVEDDMAALFYAMQAGTDAAAGASEQMGFGEAPATGFEVCEVSICLILAPALNRVGTDVEEIGFGLPGGLKACHLWSMSAA
jgi:hypothetical protein